MPEERRICQCCKKEFRIEPEDLIFYEKVQVPPPTWCWQCRAMRRMCFRNMTRLYPQTCAATGKRIFSLIPPEAPITVYDYDYWISDAWDPLSYGREYDFSRPFLEQFRELYYAVPWANVHSLESINSDYCSGLYCKNCYLCFDAGIAEDSAYSVTLQRSKQCFDTINCKLCELCYFSINLSKSYKVFFSRNSASCSEVWFSDDCIGCSNCFGCLGLRNKQYHIFNQPYSKADYEKKLSEMVLDSWSGISSASHSVRSFWLTRPVKYQHGFQANGSTGDYLFNVNRLRNCFFSDTAEDCAHCQSIIYHPIKDCMDVTSCGLNIERCYESVCSGEGFSNVRFCFDDSSVTNSSYTTNCRQANNLFGCVGVRSRDYCILNRQYSKEEYHRLVPRIIQHMNDMPYIDGLGREYKYGEFLPPEFSPYGYNATQAQEYFPLDEKQAATLGFRWQTEAGKGYTATKSSGELPDRISAVGDDILPEVIRCEHDEEKGHPYDCASNCATVFRLIPEELQFYRAMKLPLPRLCFHCRHFQLVAERNKPKLYPGRCQCGGATNNPQLTTNNYKNTAEHFHGEGECPNEFETTYPPDSPHIIYCESCYQSEVA